MGIQAKAGKSEGTDCVSKDELARNALSDVKTLIDRAELTMWGGNVYQYWSRRPIREQRAEV